LKNPLNIAILPVKTGVWRLSKKGGKKRFLVPSPKKNPAGAGWFKRLCPIRANPSAVFVVIGVQPSLFNYHSNLSMRGTFLQKLIHLPDNRGLLATPKEIIQFKFECRHSERLVISNFSIDLLYQKIVQSWIFLAQPPSPRQNALSNKSC